MEIFETGEFLFVFVAGGIGFPASAAETCIFPSLAGCYVGGSGGVGGAEAGEVFGVYFCFAGGRVGGRVAAEVGGVGGGLGAAVACG